MMSSESVFNISVIKVSQAINDDYKDTGYDRGHLNPYSFHVGDHRVATFTLTNAVPMDACFNRVHWKEWETELRNIIQEKFHADINKATAYIVTGTIPSPSHRIPKKGEFNEDEVRDFDRVTVPSHVWTALCYKHLTDDHNSFSLAYIGENQPESNIRVMSVREVNSVLRDLFPQEVQIFDDDCFSDNQQSQKAANKLYKRIQLSLSRRLQIPPDVLDTFQKQPSSIDLQPFDHPTKRTKANSMLIMRSFDNTSSFFEELEKLMYVTESPCLLTKVTRSDVECRQVLQNSEIGSKTAADGTPCKSPVSPVYCVCETGSEHGTCLVIPKRSIAEEITRADYWRGLRCCDTESGLIPYCTSPCLYQKKLRDYRCYSGQSYIQCSPQYSLITANGEKCKDDRPCATYGLDYYWCEKASGSSDYCSPPLPDSITKTGKKCRINHACGKYGKTYYWCYPDDSKWEYCCTHNDRFSAVNGKTCKPNHPCGHHDKDYLWCSTTDGNWDYCCVGE